MDFATEYSLLFMLWVIWGSCSAIIFSQTLLPSCGGADYEPDFILGLAYAVDCGFGIGTAFTSLDMANEMNPVLIFDMFQAAIAALFVMKLLDDIMGYIHDQRMGMTAAVWSSVLEFGLVCGLCPLYLCLIYGKGYIFAMYYGFEVGTTSGMAWFNPDGCTQNDLIFHVLYSFVSVPMFGAWCGSMGAAIFEEIKEFDDI